jgi:hypothetical protein
MGHEHDGNIVNADEQDTDNVHEVELTGSPRLSASGWLQYVQKKSTSAFPEKFHLKLIKRRDTARGLVDHDDA